MLRALGYDHPVPLLPRAVRKDESLAGDRAPCRRTPIWIKKFEAVVKGNTIVEYRINANITFEVKK
jgi:hypothetical protein